MKTERRVMQETKMVPARFETTTVPVINVQLTEQEARVVAQLLDNNEQESAELRIKNESWCYQLIGTLDVFGDGRS